MGRPAYTSGNRGGERGALEPELAALAASIVNNSSRSYSSAPPSIISVANAISPGNYGRTVLRCSLFTGSYGDCCGYRKKTGGSD